MTICVSVRVPDGIVLGTDSMSAVMGIQPDGQYGIVKTYKNARKLVQIANSPIGVFIYGQANIGKRSVYELIGEFDFDAKFNTVGKIATKLAKYIEGEYQREFSARIKEEQPTLGLYLAGSSPESQPLEEWEIRFPRNPTLRKPRQDEDYGVEWRGITTPFMRLYRGYDPEVLTYLQASGAAPQQVKKIKEGNEFSTLIAFNFMPLQDAVDFAAFVLRTTIRYNQFEIGNATCGGSLQIAAITAESGFQWVQEPRLHLKEDSDDWT